MHDVSYISIHIISVVPGSGCWSSVKNFLTHLVLLLLLSAAALFKTKIHHRFILYKYYYYCIYLNAFLGKIEGLVFVAVFILCFTGCFIVENFFLLLSHTRIVQTKKQASCCSFRLLLCCCSIQNYSYRLVLLPCPASYHLELVCVCSQEASAMTTTVQNSRRELEFEKRKRKSKKGMNEGGIDPLFLLTLSVRNVLPKLKKPQSSRLCSLFSWVSFSRARMLLL